MAWGDGRQAGLWITTHGTAVLALCARSSAITCDNAANNVHAINMEGVGHWVAEEQPARCHRRSTQSPCRLSHFHLLPLTNCFSLSEHEHTSLQRTVKN